MTQAVGEFYESRVSEHISVDFRERYGSVLRMLLKDLSVRGRLLDVGCGAGMFLRLASEYGFEVEGLEPNSQAAKHVRESYGIEVHATRIEEYSNARRYDVVTMWDLLEHLRDPRAALSKATELLKRRGVLIVECPVRDSLINRVARAVYVLSYGAVRRPLFLIFGIHHLHYFSKSGLLRLLTESGFTVMQILRFETDLSSLKRKPGRGLMGELKAHTYNLALSVLFSLARITRSKNKVVVIAQFQNAGTSV